MAQGRAERSAFAEALAASWGQLCEGFEQLLAHGGVGHEQAPGQLDELDRSLHAQLALEEELMLPPFELEAHAQADLLRAEHRHLRGLLQLVQTELAEGGLSTRLANSLIRLLHQHARNAQQLLHAWADQSLPYRSKVRILERERALWLDSQFPPVPRDKLAAEPSAASKMASNRLK